MSDNTFTFKDGTRVIVTLDGKSLRGTVIGAATTPFPIMGRVWIVTLDDGQGFPNDTYPFRTVSAPEVMLRVPGSDSVNYDFHNMQPKAAPSGREHPQCSHRVGCGCGACSGSYSGCRQEQGCDCGCMTRGL